MDTWKRAKPLKKEDFKHFDGYFLNEELANNIHITNFDNTLERVRTIIDSGTGYISFTGERIQASVGGAKRNWVNGANVVKQYISVLSLYVTEEPVHELIHEIPQFIVPNTWEFMYQVGTYLRNNMDSPVVAITGSVGKSSTRMMLNSVLREDYQVLSNFNNHNTRLAIPLYMNKLVQSPDIVSLEVSLNSLNHRGKGPQSNYIRPTIAVVTSVSHAHMSSMSGLNGLAHFKANIFEGMDENGIAIINEDISEEQKKIILNKANESTEQLLTYSMKNPEADVSLVSMKELKEITEVTVSYGGQYYTYLLRLSSPGMVENSLAVFSILVALKLDVRAYMPRLENAQVLPKVMKWKKGYIDNKQVDILDDTHNAAISSMINAIKSFTNKVPYYTGKKILVLGQVADLGSFSGELHQELLPFINNSGADCLLGYGEEMKKIVEQATLPSQWYDNLDDYLFAIRKQITEGSFLLLKGSVSGSDYNKISPLLDGLLTDNRNEGIGARPSV
ncbi:UDP-N-acetylmuramoyl-tripeptide-D-alanyl-D-alanine ligase [Enterococcus sp. AZ194]|uniref:Mur ligase family protein n=1 Tax=Enterococcus sp. AZ194 TaxID=2774629 RepID=UPI003F21AC00